MIRASLLSFVVLLAPTLASADDFSPPPWPRTNPFAVTAEWEFLTPANPAPPDGPLTNVFTKGSGTAPGGTVVDISGAGIGWGGTSGGNWFFPSDGAMHFRVDNIVDTLPVKHIRLQLTTTPGMVILLDPMASFNIGATGSVPGPVTVTGSIVSGPFGPVEHRLYSWDMVRNPPWEDFRLSFAGGGEVRQIVVDTISTVPEASTIVSFAFVTLTIGLIAWKRPKFWRLALG